MGIFSKGGKSMSNTFTNEQTAHDLALIMLGIKIANEHQGESDEVLLADYAVKEYKNYYENLYSSILNGIVRG